MEIDNIGTVPPRVAEKTPGGGSGLEETAREFEEIFVRQFVQVMTKDMFKSSLDGGDSPGWLGQQADLQAEILTDQLAKHMTERGTLNIAEMLLRQWRARDMESTIPAAGTSESD